MRTPLIGGNWKMYKDPAGTASFFERFRPLVKPPEHCEIVICPSFLDLVTAVTATRGMKIQIGAQNLYWANDALVLAYQGIDYTRQKKVLDVGSVHLTTETHERIPLPPIPGGLALPGGVVLLVIGAKDRS